MGGRTSTTRPKGNGPGVWGAAKGKGGEAFTPDNQPPPERKSAGHEARAMHLAELAKRNEQAYAVIDRALSKASESDEPQMLNVGARVAFSVFEAQHGKPAQAITGDQGGPLTVAIRRIVDTGDNGT